eukprot:328977-Amphidinium_carterae.1
MSASAESKRLWGQRHPASGAPMQMAFSRKYTGLRSNMLMGVALDLGNVMKYVDHNVLARWLLKEMHRAPPEGYAA